MTNASSNPPYGLGWSPFDNLPEGLADRITPAYKVDMAVTQETEAERDPLLAAFGRRVYQLRILRGLKPSEFAKAAGVSQQYQWRLEDGQQNVNLRTLAKIAIALEVPMTELIDGIEPEPSIVLTSRPYRHKVA